MLRLKTLILALLAASLAHAQLSVGRPILFVHGFCGQASDWGVLLGEVTSFVTGSQPSLYASETNYDIYYDGQSVKTWPDGKEFLSNVPPSARFFSINFFDELSFGGNGAFSSINTIQVAQVSILNKADELAHVMLAITTLTHVKDMIVIAHSMGGLVARAYIENQAIPYTPSTACTDQGPVPYSCVIQAFPAGGTYYQNDVAKLITIDTPHGGAVTANWSSWLNSSAACFLEKTLNRRELEDPSSGANSFVISTLNNNASNPPDGLSIASIQSFTSPGLLSAFDGGALDDGVVTALEQSIQNVTPSVPQYYDRPNSFAYTPYTIPTCPESGIGQTWPLHLLGCVGAQPSTAVLVAIELNPVLTTVNALVAVSGLVPSSTSTGGSSFALTVNGSNFAVGAVVQWNGAALPTTFVSATQLTATVSASLIASPGTVSITVSSGGNVSAVISFTISPSNPPSTVSVGGVTNAASFAKDANGNGSAVAPGSLVTIFGTYPGATTASAPAAPFLTSLGGVSVTFNGIPAPLNTVVPTGAFPFINAQVPFEVLSAGQTSGTANVVVMVNGVSSAPQAIPIVPVAPGVFTIPPTGQGYAILAFVDPTDNTAKIAAPASASAAIGYPTAPIPIGQPGFFYATGLGAMTPLVTDGTADLTVTHFANATPTVMVGGITAQVQFAGQAPGYPGVNQINIVIPNSAATGNAVPLQIQTADGKIISTPGATIAIRSGSTQNLGFTITTVAGNGAPSYAGDNGVATAAQLAGPGGVAVDAVGNVYIADIGNQRIRKVATNGTITTVAGNGTAAYLGDGGPATSAALSLAGLPSSGVAVDAAGILYIADSRNNRIRKVDTNGIITTVAGNGGGGYSGDGGLATSAQLGNPVGLAIDSAGNIYIAENTGFYCVVRKVSAIGTITTVTGNTPGYSGDGGPAANALLNLVAGLSVDSASNLYIADLGNQRIRKVSVNGIITTVAGDGNSRYDGDGGPAATFALNEPEDVAVDSAGNIYIADTSNNRIRKVDTNGIITTVAGNGGGGYSGDGGLATSATLSQPDGVALDSAGNIYIADFGNNRVRLLTPSPLVANAEGASPTIAPNTSAQGPVGGRREVVRFIKKPLSDD